MAVASADRIDDARRLRTALQQRQLDTKDLDEAITRVERLATVDVREPDDYREEARVVADLFKTVEFSLRQRSEAEVVQPALGGSADVPAEYKPLVAEYYRVLAETP